MTSIDLAPSTAIDVGLSPGEADVVGREKAGADPHQDVKVEYFFDFDKDQKNDLVYLKPTVDIQFRSTKWFNVTYLYTFAFNENYILNSKYGKDTLGKKFRDLLKFIKAHCDNAGVKKFIAKSAEIVANKINAVDLIIYPESESEFNSCLARAISQEAKIDPSRIIEGAITKREISKTEYLSADENDPLAPSIATSAVGKTWSEREEPPWLPHSDVSPANHPFARVSRTVANRKKKGKNVSRFEAALLKADDLAKEWWEENRKIEKVKDRIKIIRRRIRKIYPPVADFDAAVRVELNKQEQPDQVGSQSRLINLKDLYFTYLAWVWHLNEASKLSKRYLTGRNRKFKISDVTEKDKREFFDFLNTSSELEEAIENTIDLKGSVTILVIDDNVNTGSTFSVIDRLLKGLNPKNIRVAYYSPLLLNIDD